MFSSPSAETLSSNLYNQLLVLLTLPQLLVLSAGVVLLLMAPASFERRLGLCGLFLMMFNLLGSIALGMLQAILTQSYVYAYAEFMQLSKWGILTLQLLNAIGLGVLVLALSRHVRLTQTR